MTGLLSYGQDTTSIYFEFGSSKLNNNAENVLTVIPTQITTSIVDSIQFIGYADSVGRWDENVRLSLRRAKNAQKYLRQFYPKDLTYSMYAKGEGQLKDASKNRRVDVIVFYTRSDDDEDPVEVIENVEPRCFEVDFLALQYCNARVITKNKKEYVYIEALPNENLKNKGHYFVKEDSKNGNTVQRVRWKLKKTGSLWWKSNRYVTTIPKSSYDKYQFFTLSPGPCDGCSEEIFTKDTIIMTIAKYYPDGFLASVMQAKVRFFGGGMVKIRVPREYVNLNESYFYGSHPYSMINNYNLEWESKRSKRKSDYYFAKLQLLNGRVPYIKKYTLTTVCVNDYENGGKGCGWNGCGGVFGFPRTEFQINAEPGAFYHNDTLTGYLTMGVSYTTQMTYTALNLGLNTHLGLYANGSFKYHFFSFPFQALNPKNVWSSNTNYSITTFGRLYTGIQAKTSYNESYQSFLEANFHLGMVTVNTEMKSLFPRIYIQGGIAKDFLNRVNSNFYPYGEVGITMNIGRFFIYRNR